MWTHRLGVVLLLWMSGAAGMSPSAAVASPSAAAELATTQLPRGVRPLHYRLAISPDAATLRFSGSAAILIEVSKPTARIVLNAADLSFSSVRLAPLSGGRVLAPAAVEVQADAETVTLTFARPLGRGRYRLDMAYAGVIGTQVAGLFAIDYDTPSGRERALFTQFQSADARRVFPAWDEPAYKASFSLEATVPTRRMAVSNMPIAAAQDLGNGQRRVRFATTPRMSTYLLFFGLGDFDRATAREGRTELGVVGRSGTMAQATFALESSKIVLREYNDYFGIPYPLPKLDNIASPGGSEFFAAMENWGAIYTFEQYLLLDPASATQADRQRVFSLAAHEMAHQWFGNLVTMSWWDDLWLNEGFASWLASRTLRKLHPEWDTALDAVAARNRAMALDALATTHPVVQPVKTVVQASQAFDTITYLKGEAVIRMMEAYVGAGAWREGVRRYIKANVYGSTVSDDLWRAVEAAAGKPLGAIARDFTLQPGIPLVRLERSSCDAGVTTVDLVQTEFSVDNPAKAPLRWQVPVITRVAGAAPVSTLVVDGKARMVLPGCGAVVLNAGQSGYYRASYAPDPLAAIRSAYSGLDAIDQLGLLDDLWALGFAGTAPIADVLDLMQRIPDRADPKLWSSIAGHCVGLDAAYRGEARRQAAWRAHCNARLAPVLARIGWLAGAGEEPPVTVLRATLIRTLADLGDEPTIVEARRRYAERATNPTGYPVPLRKVILGVVAGHADGATWDELRDAAKAEKDPPAKDRFYELLARARDEALVARALALALTDEPGATRGAGMISTVAESHPDLAFDFAVAHRERIDRLVEAPSLTSYYVRLGSGSRDPAMIVKIKEFAASHIAESARRPAEAAMAEVAQRGMIARDRLPAVDDWLRAQQR